MRTVLLISYSKRRSKRFMSSTLAAPSKAKLVIATAQLKIYGDTRQAAQESFQREQHPAATPICLKRGSPLVRADYLDIAA